MSISCSKMVLRYLSAHAQTQVINTFTMEARRTRVLKGGQVVDIELVILVAVLLRHEGRLLVHFVPGETGHENFSYSYDEIKAKRVAGPEKGIFGERDNWWSLCAGTPNGWRKLEVTVRAMHEMAEYFGQVE